MRCAAPLGLGCRTISEPGLISPGIGCADPSGLNRATSKLALRVINAIKPSERFWDSRTSGASKSNGRAMGSRVNCAKRPKGRSGIDSCPHNPVAIRTIRAGVADAEAERCLGLQLLLVPPVSCAKCRDRYYVYIGVQILIYIPVYV